MNCGSWLDTNPTRARPAEATQRAAEAAPAAEPPMPRAGGTG